MKIVNLAVKRPVTMIILVSVVIILGFFTLSRMAVDLYPEMKLPVAAVITTYNGAGPEEIESQVTKPIEDTIATLSNVKKVTSTSSSGSSTIIIQYNWGTDMDNATTEIRERIGLIDAYLPDGVDKPLVVKMDPTMMPVMQMGITSKEMSMGQIQAMAEDVLQPRLERIPEVASVYITGGQEREVQVEVDPVKLENYGLSLSQVNQVLQAENFNMSSGKVVEGPRQYFVRNLQQFESVDDIKNVAITTTTGNTVYLRDIAVIKDGYKENTQMTRVDGTDAVGIACMKQSDANTVKACEAIKQQIAELGKEYNVDLTMKVTMDQSSFIRDSLNTTKKQIVEGALLAVVVLLFFLRNIRSTFIIFTSIPLSIVAAFVLMYFNHSTLNLITLGGLALGVGRIVDDSIVVFENIYRHRSLGMPPMEAAITGASEVGNAVIAATLTIIAVFLPIMFTEGLASILFKPMALTISFAILASLAVALTVIPLMSSRMLTDRAMEKINLGTGRTRKIMDSFGHWIDNLGERYKILLHWSLGHRKIIILSVTGLMIVSIALTPLVGAEFIPKMDSGEISINIETDKGSTLENTDEIVDQVEKEVGEIPEVYTRYTSVGSSGNYLSSGSETDKATLYIKLVDRSKRDKDVDTIAEEIRNKLVNVAGAKIKVNTMDATSMGGSTAGPVNVQIRGDDLQQLQNLSTQVANIVRSVPGTREVSSSVADGNPEIQVEVDRLRASSYGLTPMQVASEIRNAMNGTVATRYKVEGDEVDVKVRYAPQGHEDLASLENLTILSPRGNVVKLSQVADFRLAQGPVQIDREDQVRKAEINAYLLNRDLNSVIKDIQSKVNEMNLPAGYTVTYEGENQDMMDSFGSLGIALILAIILVYAVMAIQYESFFNPFVIMFSIPTALIGVVLGLLMTGRSFSVPAFIGLIMLVGIVVSNAIVLVDYLKQLRERGMERNSAIIEAGRVRLRPILMTAFATILAMLPLSLGLGEGAEYGAPLATVIIGGLIVSTFITLVLVPVVYSLFDDWGQKISRKFKDGRDKEAPITPESNI